MLHGIQSAGVGFYEGAIGIIKEPLVGWQVMPPIDLPVQGVLTLYHHEYQLCQGHQKGRIKQSTHFALKSACSRQECLQVLPCASSIPLSGSGYRPRPLTQAQYSSHGERALQGSLPS